MGLAAHRASSRPAREHHGSKGARFCSLLRCSLGGALDPLGRRWSRGGGPEELTRDEIRDDLYGLSECLRARASAGQPVPWLVQALLQRLDTVHRCPLSRTRQENSVLTT